MKVYFKQIYVFEKKNEGIYVIFFINYNYLLYMKFNVESFILLKQILYERQPIW